MMDKRNLLKLMVLALGVSVLLFVFGYPRGEQPIDEHTIRYVIEQEPSTLEPAKSTTSPEHTVQLQLNQRQHLLKAGIFLMMVVSIPSICDQI